MAVQSKYKEGIYMQSFDGLNENQIDAIQSTEGYIRIIAGAGSGKTKVLANRYAFIVENLGISPSKILCVTFTNRAAKEMKNRIQRLLSIEPVNDFICTFHGFCVRVLREDIHKLNYPKTFTILDTEDQKSILHEIYENFGITSSTITYQKMLSNIESYKVNSNGDYIDKLITKSKPIKYNKNDSLDIKIITEYIRIQKKNFGLDFEDLMSFTFYIFEKYKDVLEKWQDKLEYVMVDETQDNSSRQWAFANLLSQKNENLFVVGDPDQSIYEWRGARPEFLVDFDKKHKDCKTVVLDQNYRSYQGILDVANSVISNNTIRVSKNMFTKKKEEAKVIHFHAKSDEEEAKWVALKIKEKLDADIDINNIAILYRASFISRAFEQALIQKEIPYVIYGGIRFFERREIKNVLAYLRTIAIGDDLSFRRIINTPSRKLGKVYLENIKTIADKENLSLYEALKMHIEEKSFNKTTAVDFVAMIEEFRKKKSDMRITDLLQNVLERSGLLESIRQDGDEDRIDNLNELAQSIKNYEQSMINEENVDLIQYLQDIALYTNLDYKNDAKFLKLMTIHQSKGLEFDVVFVVGMSEGLFPSHRSIRERKLKALEEERRLAYVAITRAGKELYLTESEGFSHETEEKYPSRFIYEIKNTCIVTEGEVPSNIKGGLGFFIHKTKQLIENKDVTDFNIGDMITHPVFGDGKIVGIEEDNYLIEFEKLYQRPKPIQKNFSELKLLNNIIQNKAKNRK
jgi:DNA helicase-2/ATP-dependent DNA helicase PcrA